MPNHITYTDVSYRPSRTAVPSLFEALSATYNSWKTEAVVNARLKIAAGERPLLEERIRWAKVELQARKDLAELAIAAERSEAAYRMAHVILQAPPHIGRALLEHAVATERLFIEWEALRSGKSSTRLNEFGLPPIEAVRAPAFKPIQGIGGMSPVLPAGQRNHGGAEIDFDDW
jgi:hypothetical protein